MNMFWDEVQINLHTLFKLNSLTSWEKQTASMAMDEISNQSRFILFQDFISSMMPIIYDTVYWLIVDRVWTKGKN